MWNYFSECFTQTSDTFAQNAQFFGKVYFPRLLVPLSKVVSGIIKFFIQAFLFLFIYSIFEFRGSEVHPSPHLYLIPLFILLMAQLGLGAGIIFSSLTTKYRDLKFLITFGVQLLMYATPIIYPMSTIPEKYHTFIWLNPMTHIIEGFKATVFGVGYMSVSGIIYSTLFANILLLAGIIMFHKTEQNFIDTV